MSNGHWQLLEVSQEYIDAYIYIYIHIYMPPSMPLGICMHAPGCRATLAVGKAAKVPSTNKQASGSSRKPQEAPGSPGKPQEAPGSPSPRKPQEAPGSSKVSKAPADLHGN